MGCQASIGHGPMLVSGADLAWTINGFAESWLLGTQHGSHDVILNRYASMPKHSSNKRWPKTMVAWSLYTSLPGLLLCWPVHVCLGSISLLTSNNWLRGCSSIRKSRR